MVMTADIDDIRAKLKSGEKEDLVQFEIEEDEDNTPEIVEEDKDSQEDNDDTSNDDDDDGDDSEGDDEGDEGKEKKPRRKERAKKRIIELNNRAKQEQERAIKAEARAAELEAQLMASQTQAAKTQKINLEKRLESSKEAMASALEDDDKNGVVRAQQEMIEVQTTLMALNNWEEQVEKTRKAPQETQKPQQSVSKEAQIWVAKNPWILRDTEKSRIAKQISIGMEVEGTFDSSTREFYEELEERVEEAMQDDTSSTKKGNKKIEKAAKPPQTTAGNTQTPAPSKGGRKTVKITREDKRLAEKMGVPLEMYAKIKASRENSNGYLSVDV